MGKFDYVLRKALKHYGAFHQMGKMIEECIELAEALIQYRQGKVGVDAVREELSDVENVVFQMRDVFGHSEVDDWRAIKVIRLNKRIDEAQNGKSCKAQEQGQEEECEGSGREAGCL